MLNGGALVACGDDETDDTSSSSAGKSAEAGTKSASSAGRADHGAGGRSRTGGRASGTSASGTGSGPVQCGAAACAARGGGFVGMFECGLDASMFGFGGCTELGAAAQQAGAMGMGMGGMIPPPRGCDDVGADARVGDAGS